MEWKQRKLVYYGELKLNRHLRKKKKTPFINRDINKRKVSIRGTAMISHTEVSDISVTVVSQGHRGTRK